MKVTVLGCGTSTGVPRIGNDWGACDPGEPRNRRLRASILVESQGERLLVDCGPDLRQQLLAADVAKLSAVVVTHDHGDHVHGIDDLRPVAQAIGGPVPLYARPEVLERVASRFAYAFARSNFYSPVVGGRALDGELTVGAARVRWVLQPHGRITSLGLRFDEGGKSIAYATDYNDLTEDMRALYEGVDVWISDCLTRRPHPTHAHLPGVLGWAREMRVGQLYLTHMGNSLDYRTLQAELPDWAAPGHDGLEILL